MCVCNTSFVVIEYLVGNILVALCSGATGHPASDPKTGRINTLRGHVELIRVLPLQIVGPEHKTLRVYMRP